MERTRRENDYFGLLKFDDWRGVFFKQYQISAAMGAGERADEFRRRIGQRRGRSFWRRSRSDQLTVIKRGASGDVLAGELELGGRSVPIIAKRPFKRYWYRYINEIGRGSRAWRAWHKAWTLVVRDIPTAWPLAVMQKRRLGYITDSVIVFERVGGLDAGGCGSGWDECGVSAR